MSGMTPSPGSLGPLTAPQALSYTVMHVLFVVLGVSQHAGFPGCPYRGHVGIRRAFDLEDVITWLGDVA
ncbi:hypothetical protein BHE74_00024672 [Ensete ventricosum]|nr:hypothetical protein GW17_00017858 [Ensete ventricosum]RWW67847.1 hypothetical protein BHE74_00024672 [Ensete ventricosum]RZS03470.1 hypothetical protein BHM03_00033651 [Ensete ventricosum]